MRWKKTGKNKKRRLKRKKMDDLKEPDVHVSFDEPGNETIVRKDAPLHVRCPNCGNLLLIFILTDSPTNIEITCSKCKTLMRAKDLWVEPMV